MPQRRGLGRGEAVAEDDVARRALVLQRAFALDRGSEPGHARGEVGGERSVVRGERRLVADAQVLVDALAGRDLR